MGRGESAVITCEWVGQVPFTTLDIFGKKHIMLLMFNIVNCKSLKKYIV
jgi:hypothetical protein